jgi:hypothetical protein
MSIDALKPRSGADGFSEAMRPIDRLETAQSPEEHLS